MQGNVGVVFFDIGATLGSIGLDPSGTPVTFDVYGHVPPVLRELKSRGLRIGIISNTGNHPGSKVTAVLSQSVIWQHLETDLLIYSADVGLEKDSPEIFNYASQAAKTEARQCLYVGEDSWERLHAAKAGMQISPHPLLAQDAIDGERIRFVRLSPPEDLPASQLRGALQGRSFVPLHISSRERSKLVGITTASTLTALANAQIEVEPLGSVDAPLLSDLYLLRDDRAARTGFLSFEGQSAAFFAAGEQANWLVSSTSEGLLVALPAGRSVEEFHFEEAYHGHNLKLTPDLTLLTSFDAVLATASFVEVDESFSDELSEAEREILSRLTDASIEKNIDAYIGTAPLGDGGDAVRSRHIHSADNERVVNALAKHFSSVSDQLRVRLHPFTHEGKRLFNVEAELGPDGSGELVLVTAHLDSTAAFSPPYDPRTDYAPGADDDASGVAGVLAIAEAIASLATLRPPERAVRFVLFNAEEHGLVGSKAYARDQAAKAAPIVAVLQMDMIGYNVEAPRTWELHAGYWPSQEVQRRSLALAERVSRLTGQVSPELQAPQLYVSQGPLPADRDPAESRSDHAAFQERGYPACVASEDFFAGPDAHAPEPEGNPHYHQKEDTFVDASYAADIARVVAASAWMLARGPSS
jgi:bacterial leucyl aminopeptidase